MRILTLTLNMPLHPGDIIGFRSAVSELVGREHTLFHQHVPSAEEAGGLSWDYPRIQYGVRRGRGVILGIDAGAAAIRQHLLPVLSDELSFAGRTHRMTGYSIRELQEEPVLLDTAQPFALSGWLALNAENYVRWKSAAEHPALRSQLLDRVLTGHLRAFAEGVGVADYKDIVAHVDSVDRQKKITWHGTSLIRFDVQASANFLPPVGIGLGRAAAFGFGQLQSQAEYFRQRERLNERLSREVDWAANTNRG